ncbi:hypothetical protein BDE02_14G155600 [Populus trichocarpa]|nr:hypothetical protein BDE02_14G155600 [Populus trichocarpa]
MRPDVVGLQSCWRQKHFGATFVPFYVQSPGLPPPLCITWLLTLSLSTDLTLRANPNSLPFSILHFQSQNGVIQCSNMMIGSSVGTILIGICNKLLMVVGSGG